MQDVEGRVSRPPDALAPVAVGRSRPEQIVAQQAAIAQIGQRALSAESVEMLFDDACALVARVLETELVDILELAPDRGSLRVIAGVGWRPGVVGQLTVGASSDSQSGYTVDTGGPVIVADLASEDRFKVAPVLLEHGAASGISVRIGDADDAYGVIAAFTARRGRFTRDDAHFLEAVANVLAAAIARSRVETELRASRDELSAIVAGIDEGITVQGPDGRLIYANDTAALLSGYESGSALVSAPLADVLDRFELVDEDDQPLPVDRLPSRRALAGESPAPVLVGFAIKATGEKRWSLVSATPIRGPDGEVRRVINTFRDVTEERWVRQTRQFVADAVSALSSTLEIGEAATRLAELAVPRLADYCTVDLVAPDGSITSPAIAHTDPQRLRLARRVREMRPVDPNAPTGVGRVIREATPELMDVTPEMLAASARNEEELQLLLALELRSYVCVPLMGRHGAIGALTLVAAESGRRLGERDLSLAQEVGQRAGIALENARLYQTANDRRAQLDAVLAALDESVLVFDANGRLRLSNQAAQRAFAFRPPQTIEELGERLRLDLHGPDGIGEGEPVDVAVDGTRWLEVRRYRARQIPDPPTAGLAPTVVVLRDVTREHAAEVARDAFMGVLSHELRTPITTIYGGSELLERGLDEDRRREVIADIRVESERLARLVEDLLVMTRVERGMVEIADEPILLQHLLRSVAQALASRVPGLEIDLELTERLPAVRGDATYVEQVVRNLLTNAVRYGRGTTDGIRVTAVEHDGFVTVRVLDRGPGFGEVEPERLFDLFFRTSAAQLVPGGAGIGLFVCRHLIEAMGGRIWARGRDEGGAEFGFALPVMESDYSG